MSQDQFNELVSMIKVLETKLLFLEMDLREVKELVEEIKNKEQ